MIALLLMYVASRLHALLALPMFLDEASHLTRAQWVWQGQPFYLLETGKALAPYLAALFWPFSGALFLGRVVVILIGTVGLAAAYAAGKALHSRDAGLLAALLWVAAPQLFFYERMALVDTTVGALAMLALGLAVRLARSGSLRAAVLCGVALALTVLAKLTGLVFAPLAILAAILTPGGAGWRRRARAVLACYLTFALLLAGPALYILSRGADPTGQSSGLTSLDARSLGDRLAANLGESLDAERVYFSDPLLLFLLAGIGLSILFRPRRAILALTLAILPLAAVMVTAQTLWLRYLAPATPFLLLAAAVGWAAGAQWLARRLPRGAILVRAAPWAIAALWAVSNLSFFVTAYREPARLPLPQGDHTEYVRWIPSGFGMREAAAYLDRLAAQDGPLVAVGVAVNCNAARLYLPYGSPATLVCPDLDWGGRNYAHIVDLMGELLAREGVIYVLDEDKNPPTAPPDAFPGLRVEIADFARPTGQYTVRLYRLLPAE